MALSFIFARNADRIMRERERDGSIPSIGNYQGDWANARY